MNPSAVQAWCDQYGIDPDTAIRLLNQELAKATLIEYGKAVYPGFQAPKHIRYLADLLERVERGEVKRLAISFAPGHGKSTLLQCFISWCLGRNQRRRFLALSAKEDLAQRNSRAMREMVKSDGWPWPEIKLVGEAIEEWYTTGGGGVRAIGRTGTVTGFRAEGILCDDIQPDEGTEKSRQDDEIWFRNVLSTRLEPDGFCVIIQTRWHDDDIIGRLQDGASADQWVFINIPALAGENDVLGRKEGEALWPERWPVELLLEKKAEMLAEGQRASSFEAQYMGSPVPSTGATFESSWFEHRYDTVPSFRIDQNEGKPLDAMAMMYMDSPLVRPRLPVIRLQAIDCAAKTGVRNDRTAIATLVTDLRDIYVEDVWFDRVTFTELKTQVQERYNRFRPQAVYVEEASSGFALLDELRGSTLIPLVGVKPGTDSKEARAESTTGLFQAGKIKFPRSAPWMQELLGEFLRFPHGKHDDIVDAIVIGILQMQVTIARVLRNERWKQQTDDDLGDWMSR